MSSGGKMLATMRVLLGDCFSGIIALSSPIALVAIVRRRVPRIVLLSVGFASKVGANGRNLF